MESRIEAPSLDASGNKLDRVVIAGGGTAGHVLPGLSIAEAMVARRIVENRQAVDMVGSARGVEAELLKSTDFGVHLLPGRGIQRRLTPSNLFSLFALALATFRAVFLLLRRRPQVVVNLGGYASIPCGVAAILLRIPVVVAEQNAVPGAANRLVGRFARASAVSFPGTDLPRAVVTGNPLRAEIRAAVSSSSVRSESRSALSLDKRPFVLAFGGSLGSRRINRAVSEAVAEWAGESIVVQHVVGSRGWTTDPPELAASIAAGVDYRPVEYEVDMPTVLCAADLVICRAGATTVAELTALGVPAILVPLPGSPGDHQTANARQVVAAGGAKMLAEEFLSGQALGLLLAEMLADDKALKVMSESSRSIGRPDAADKVVELIVEVLSEKGRRQR